MSGSGEGPEADIPEGDRFPALEFLVHCRGVWCHSGHLECAEECLTRRAGAQDRGIARSGIDLRPRHLAQVLGASGMVAVYVGEQDGAHAAPIESQLRHLGLERTRIGRQARIDQDEPLLGLHGVGRRWAQAAEEVDPRRERARAGTSSGGWPPARCARFGGRNKK